MADKLNVMRFSEKEKVKLNLDKQKEDYYELILIGKHKYTLRDFRLEGYSDGVLRFNALLCDDGKILARCSNNGDGIEINHINVQAWAIMVSMRKYLERRIYIKDKQEHNVTLEFVVDTLAEGEYIRLSKTIKGRSL